MHASQAQTQTPWKSAGTQTVFVVTAASVHATPRTAAMARKRPSTKTYLWARRMCKRWSNQAYVTGSSPILTRIPDFSFIVPPPPPPPDIHRQSLILRVHLLSAGRMCKVSGASRRTKRAMSEAPHSTGFLTLGTVVALIKNVVQEIC